MELVWLVLALVAGGLAWTVGWPAWNAYRQREARERHADRYRAWRGRAQPAGSSTGEGMTGEERRRLVIAAALGLASLACVVVFFVVS